MPSLRILLQQRGVAYRFLKMDARPDGSIILLVDRDASAIGESISDGANRTSERDIAANSILPHAKFSIHTTGQINFYPHRKERQSKSFIEPLFKLTKSHLVGLYSIPDVTRLDVLNQSGGQSDSDLKITVPDDLSGRITTFFEIAPTNHTLGQLETEFARLSYEVYDLIFRTGKPPDFVAHAKQHFFVGVNSPPKPLGAPSIIKPDEAELLFHQKVHDESPPVFRNGDGSYVALAAVVMRIPPKLTIMFDRLDLSFEQIPFEYGLPSHKVRFWVSDRGGRNKQEDLRRHITGITLNARFELDDEAPDRDRNPSH